MPNLYCTSDTHFSHRRLWETFDMGRKAWSQSPEEMDEHMIRCWNSVVTQEDVVLHLGDFVFGPPDHITYIRSRLNGTLWLVLGNHDRTATSMRAHLPERDHVTRRLVFTQAGATRVCRHRPQDFTDQDLGDPLVEWWHGHVHDRPHPTTPRHRLFGVDAPGGGPTPTLICDLNQVEKRVDP